MKERWPRQVPHVGGDPLLRWLSETLQDADIPIADPVAGALVELAAIASGKEPGPPDLLAFLVEHAARYHVSRVKAP